MATRRLTKNGSFNIGHHSPKDDLSILDNKYINLPSELFTQDMNILDLEAGLLSHIILAIFKLFIKNMEYNKVSPLALKDFVIDVCDAYLEVPYHNLHHATNVLHTTYILLDKCGMFQKLDPDVLFATLIAAFVHDVGHPGNNNLFEVNTCSELALRYNDFSVLEQYHCATGFELIKKHNLHSLMSQQDFRTFRKTIVSCIMGTDMSQHKSMTDLLISKKVSCFDLSSLNEQILLCKLLLHAADIGNPIHSLELCEKWARLVSQEFHNQIVKEKELGFTPFCSLDIHCEMSFLTSEIGYIKFVCQPYWNALYVLFPEYKEQVERIQENLRVFTDKLEEIKRQNVEEELEKYC